MHGVGDELVEGGADLAAAGVDFEGGRLAGDVGAEAAPGFDEAFAFEDPVDLGDGEGVEAELGGDRRLRGRDVRRS